MVQSGITKAFSAQYKNQIVCCLNDEDAVALAAEENITRSQAGIRKALKEYPEALYVVGNAPTALMEITEQLRNDKNLKLKTSRCYWCSCRFC